MNAIAINGSPRKKWNTATLLENALRGCRANGEMRSLMERLLFPYLTYTADPASISPREIATALVYTMNAPEEEMSAIHQDSSVAASRGIMTRIFGSCEVLLSTDTCQFDDYSKYVSTRWDPAVKARRRKDVFPQDCLRAYDLGARLSRETTGSVGDVRGL